MADFGIKVSSEKTDVFKAKGKDLLLTSQYPFHKLDVENVVSFQNISLLFVSDPPNPDGTIQTSLTTNVYTFKHGYNYVPATWLLAQRAVGAGVVTDPTSNRYSAYFYEGGLIAADNTSDLSPYAALDYVVDSENITLSVTKYYDAVFGFGSPVNISGYSLDIRIYVFVEDLVGSGKSPL